MSIFTRYPKPDSRRTGMKGDYLIIHGDVAPLPLYGAVKISDDYLN